MKLTDAEARKLQRLAARADALLEDEDFKLMVADLKNTAIRDWAEAPTASLREECWHRLHAIAGLESLMRKYGETWRTTKANHGG